MVGIEYGRPVNKHLGHPASKTGPFATMSHQFITGLGATEPPAEHLPVLTVLLLGERIMKPDRPNPALWYSRSPGESSNMTLSRRHRASQAPRFLESLSIVFPFLHASLAHLSSRPYHLSPELCGHIPAGHLTSNAFCAAH